MRSQPRGRCRSHTQGREAGRPAGRGLPKAAGWRKISANHVRLAPMNGRVEVVAISPLTATSRHAFSELVFWENVAASWHHRKKHECGKRHKMDDALKHRSPAGAQRNHAEKQRYCQQALIFGIEAEFRVQLKLRQLPGSLVRSWPVRIPKLGSNWFVTDSFGPPLKPPKLRAAIPT